MIRRRTCPVEPAQVYLYIGSPGGGCLKRTVNGLSPLAAAKRETHVLEGFGEQGNRPPKAFGWPAIRY